MRAVQKFFHAEQGAVTVDWVVLTAAIVGVMFGALTVFTDASRAHADLTSTTMENRQVGTF